MQIVFFLKIMTPSLRGNVVYILILILASYLLYVPSHILVKDLSLGRRHDMYTNQV